MNARIATLRLSLMLVSRVCLGINVFDVNIEREGKENVASVSTIRIGNVEFPGFHPPFFFLASLFYGPFLDSLQNVKHRHACVIVPLPIPFFLSLSTFYLLYSPPA